MGSERASFHDVYPDGSSDHPSMAEKGMTTIRLQRLHFNSRPCLRTLAMSCPHSQRVSLPWSLRGAAVLVTSMAATVRRK